AVLGQGLLPAQTDPGAGVERPLDKMVGEQLLGDIARHGTVLLTGRTADEARRRTFPHRTRPTRNSRPPRPSAPPGPAEAAEARRPSHHPARPPRRTRPAQASTERTPHPLRGLTSSTALRSRPRQEVRRLPPPGPAHPAGPSCPALPARPALPGPPRRLTLPAPPCPP